MKRKDGQRSYTSPKGFFFIAIGGYMAHFHIEIGPIHFMWTKS